MDRDEPEEARVEGRKGEFHVLSSTILICGESWGNLKNITPGKTSPRGES